MSVVYRCLTCNQKFNLREEAQVHGVFLEHEVEMDVDRSYHWWLPRNNDKAEILLIVLLSLVAVTALVALTVLALGI